MHMKIKLPIFKDEDAKDAVTGQSEDKWGKLHGPLRQQCTGEYHHAKVCQ